MKEGLTRLIWIAQDKALGVRVCLLSFFDGCDFDWWGCAALTAPMIP